MQKINFDNFWLKVIYILFLIILLFPYYHLTDIPQAGIDNSWRIGLELAKAKGLVFGQDILFTYGPLGYLSQRQPIDTSNWQFMLYDVFVFFNIGLLLYFFLPKPAKLYHFLVHFFVFYLISAFYGEWIHFALFFVGIFIGLKYLHTPQLWLLFHSIFLGIILFFTKANYGIAALGFSVFLLAYLFFTKRLVGKNFLILLGFTITLLVGFSYFLKTDLINYFYASLEVVNGYNSSLSVYPSERLRLVGSSYLVFGLLVLAAVLYLGWSAKSYWFQIRTKITKRLNISQLDDIFIIGCVGVISFILIKYAFVRADDGHIASFVKLANLPFLLFPFFAKNTFLKRVGWGLLSLNMLTYLVFYQPVFGKISFNLSDNLRTKSYIFPEYFKDALSEKKDYTKPTYPKEVLEIIGNKTVDIIPTEISEIYFNRLNYNPRPAFQSYQAYNLFLDKKNKEKYLSNHSPDFVVYGVESTDNKYGFAEETQTLMALLQHYEPQKIWDKRLLLQKKVVAKKLTLISKKSTNWELNKEFVLSNPTNKIHLISVKINYNWWGKLLNFFFQPPHLTMDLVLENKQKTTFRTVPMLLEKGMIVGSKIENVADVKQFFEENKVTDKGIKSIRFDEIIRKKAGFNSKIEIIEEWYELK